MSLMLLADVSPEMREGLALSFILGLAAIGWPYAISRIRAGRPLVEPSEQRQVPWDGAIALFALLIYALITLLLTPLLAAMLHRAANPGLPDPPAEISFAEALADPTWLTARFQAQSVLSLVAMAAVLTYLRLAGRASWADFGLSLNKFGRHLKLGLLAFTVIFPPVIVLNGLLNAMWRKSEHPIIVGYRASGDETLFVWSAIAAVAVAPLVEEFIFRDVLQGWLQRLFADRGRSDEAAVAGPDEAARAVQPPASIAPIVISSFLFAAVHQFGPDWPPLFLLALGLGYLYRQTHSLWPGIIVHTLLNAWSMAALYFLPDA